jgi:hypothetical protein
MILTINQTAEIKGAIASALERVYSQDFLLIQNRAHERSIAFRFGFYFSEIIEFTSFGNDIELTIDFDYNRNGEGVKDMEGFSLSHGVYPDIILHRRGYNNKNVVVFEFKPAWRMKGYQEDLEKLIGFTNPIINDYQYGLGVFIRFGETLDNCEIVYYKNGELE